MLVTLAFVNGGTESCEIRLHSRLLALTRIPQARGCTPFHPAQACSIG